MQLNQYNLYSMNTQNYSKNHSNKIQDDIRTMQLIKEYSEILSFVENNYGSANPELEKELPDNVKVSIYKDDTRVDVIVLKNEEQLFGRRWKLVSVNPEN